MILTSLETNINLNKNFDNKKNKFIWVVDGKGIKKKWKKLDEEWNKLTIMSIEQFDNFIKQI
jgi:hypothetical protein